MDRAPGAIRRILSGTPLRGWSQWRPCTRELGARLLPIRKSWVESLPNRKSRRILCALILFTLDSPVDTGVRRSRLRPVHVPECSGARRTQQVCRPSWPGPLQSDKTIARSGRLLTRSGRLPSLSPDAGARRFLNGGEPTTVPFHSAAALADEILMVLLGPK